MHQLIMRVHLRRRAWESGNVDAAGGVPPSAKEGDDEGDEGDGNTASPMPLAAVEVIGRRVCCVLWMTSWLHDWNLWFSHGT
jgi:hypothetical protein